MSFEQIDPRLHGLMGNAYQEMKAKIDAERAHASRQSRWSAVELMQTEFPDPKYAVPGIVPEGLLFLVGPPKIGKSWMAYGLAIAVAAGGKALGSIDVERGPVLYLALEDTPRRLRSRLKLLLGESPPPKGLDIWTRCPAIPDGGAEELGAWLAAHPAARLVIVDVLAKVRGRRNPQANGYDVDYAAGEALKVIADEYEVAIVVNHHTRKASAEDFLDEVSGTQGLAGSADSVAVLRRARGSADGILKVTGRDIEEAEHALTFAADLGAWQLLAGPASDYDVAKTRSRILGLIRERESGRPKDVAEALGLDDANVRQTMRRMVDDGQLDTDGHGNYFRTAADE